MANKLENIVVQALRTFKNPSRRVPENLVSALNDLKRSADVITIEDIPKLKFLLQKSQINAFNRITKQKTNPVDYLPIYEDEDVTIGVFVLKQGSRLPIHDHPSMHGILKILQGVVKITSYSLVEIDTSSAVRNNSFFYNNPLKVIKHPENLVTDRDSCCMLTPTEKNIHEVECIEGPAAFLDILSPPYEEGSLTTPRSCHYFEEVAGGDDNLRLIQVPSPINFWVDDEES